MTLEQLSDIILLAQQVEAPGCGWVHFSPPSKTVVLPILVDNLSEVELEDFAELGVYPTQEGLMSFRV